MKRALYLFFSVLFVLSVSISCFAVECGSTDGDGGGRGSNTSESGGSGQSNTSNDNFSEVQNNTSNDNQSENTNETEPSKPQYSSAQILDMMRHQNDGEDESDYGELLSSLAGTSEYQEALAKYQNECREINKRQKEKQKSEFDGEQPNPKYVKDATPRTPRVDRKSGSFRKPSVMSYVDAKYITAYKAYTIARKSSNANLKRDAAHYLRVYREATAEKIRIMQEDELYTPQSPKNPARKYNEKFSQAHGGNYRDTESLDINSYTSDLKEKLEKAANAGKYINIDDLIDKFKKNGNKNYVSNSKKRSHKALEKDESYGDKDSRIKKSGISDDETVSSKDDYSKKDRDKVNNKKDDKDKKDGKEEDEKDKVNEDKPGSTPAVDRPTPEEWFKENPGKTLQDYADEFGLDYE